LHLKYFGIRVTNLERSLNFYIDLLGLKEVKRGDCYERKAGIWVLLRDEESHQELELNWYPEGSPYNTEYSPGEGLDHIGFVVEDVEAKYNALVAMGAGPTQVDPASTEGWAAYVKDPDGNWIELFQLTPPPRHASQRT
jgi:lactoylglutathione lyase